LAGIGGHKVLAICTAEHHLAGQDGARAAARRNPLRRASDRMETAVLGLLLAAFLAAAPLAAHAAGTWASARFTAGRR
jgi:hypothetical protein